MSAFNANDYRKRVLAAVEARGGVSASDPFEWYDVPLDAADSLTDDAVADRVEAVWAFWQKHRDHPKYRGLVTALLAVHQEVAPALCARQSRRQLAARTRTARAERDEARFADLDATIERLMERFGGIPGSKRAGVLAFAAQAGIDPASAEARLARYPVIDDEPASGQPAATPMSPVVYRQVRANLEELGRILGAPAFVSLYDLLGLDPAAPRPVLARAREVAAARNRELRPDRRRALVDDLLAAVTTLLLDGDPEAYLDMLAGDVTERLRPRVAAAVLVEDELTADDYTHLVGEAEALGLDHDRAVRAVSGLARELGVAVPQRAAPTRSPAPGRGPIDTRRPSTPGRAPERTIRPPTPVHGAAGSGSATVWHEKLSQARAALRAGRVIEAQSLVEEARRLAGGTMPPIRAVGDEVADVLTEARQRWQAALDALAVRRFTEAASSLERLLAIAADVPGPAGQSAADALAEANRGTAAATTALHNAESLGGQARELALLGAFEAAPDHPGLLAALHEIGVQPATDVRTRQAGGGVVVSWAPSASPGTIEYRVQRVATDGRLVAAATTHRTELEVALPRAGDPTPVYVVVARRAGVCSADARSDTPARPAPVPADVRPPAPAPAAQRPADVRPADVRPADLPPPVGSLVVLPHGKRVRLVYPAPAVGRVEVRRLPDGARPPAPGSVVPDPASCGEVVPGMGPGLAVDRRPSAPTGYVALTIDGVAVAGAATWYLDLPPVTGMRVADGLLRWDWPTGCTEVMVVWRTDAPPEAVGDPAAGSRKVTNTRYKLDGGFALPSERPLHVAAFTCTRMNGVLAVATGGARLTVG